MKGNKEKIIKKLNRIIQSIAFGKLNKILEYKTLLDEGHLYYIISEYTSILCEICLCIDKRNRKTQEEFSCIIKECLNKHKNADMHA